MAYGHAQECHHRNDAVNVVVAFLVGKWLRRAETSNAFHILPTHKLSGSEDSDNVPY
jgi:hypothetical protein